VYLDRKYSKHNERHLYCNLSSRRPIVSVSVPIAREAQATNDDTGMMKNII